MASSKRPPSRASKRTPKFDEALAARLRGAVEKHGKVREVKMMGGLCFMLDGHMAAGVIGDKLVLRVGKAAHAGALKQPHVSLMTFTGRPLGGFVYVAKAGVKTGPALQRWVKQAATFTKTLESRT